MPSDPPLATIQLDTRDYDTGIPYSPRKKFSEGGFRHSIRAIPLFDFF